MKMSLLLEHIYKCVCTNLSFINFSKRYIMRQYLKGVTAVKKFITQKTLPRMKILEQMLCTGVPPASLSWSFFF